MSRAQRTVSPRVSVSSTRATWNPFLLLVIVLVLGQILFGRCNAAQRRTCVVSSSLCIIQSGTSVYMLADTPMAVSITISNIMGTPLLEFRRLYLSPGKNRFNLARFHLPPGIYILLLDGDNIHIAQRFIIGSWWRAPAQ